MDENLSAVVIGVGPEKGLGATLAKCFAAKGLHVFIASRNENRLQTLVKKIHDHGGKATAVVADATIEHEINHLFELATLENRRIDIAAYNVDSNYPAPLLDMEPETFETLWRQNCFGALLFGQQAVKHMQPHKKGTLFYTGATASLRAKPPFTAFSSAKSALRSLAQGMAREFGPSGIHVVHAIIDGVINGDRARSQFPEFVAKKQPDGLIELQSIAELYWFLHTQPADAWTHEIDLRPFKELF